MRNIIKSDFYYHCVNIKIYIYAMLFMFVYIIGTSIGNMEWASNQTLYSIIRVMIKQQYMMIMIILLGITCYYQGKMFGNRFLIYQVVSYGKRKTLLSKYIVQITNNVAFVTGLVLCSLVILCNVYQVRNGINIGVVLFYLLFILLIIRYTVRLLTMNYLVRSGIKAAIFTWMIVVAEWMPCLIGQEYNIVGLLDISIWFLPGQINSLTISQSLVEILPYIFITTIIELGLEIICIRCRKDVV